MISYFLKANQLLLGVISKQCHGYLVLLELQQQLLRKKKKKMRKDLKRKSKEEKGFTLSLLFLDLLC